MSSSSGSPTADGHDEQQQTEIPGTESVGDVRQLVLPHVDTAPDLAEGRFRFKITPATALLSLPAIGTLVAGVWFVAMQSFGLGAVFLVATIAIGLAAMVAHVSATTTMYPHERIMAAGKHLWRRWSFPWGYDEALAHADDLHAIRECITIDIGNDSETRRANDEAASDTPETAFAGVRTHDGRAVVPIRLHGSNTEYLNPGNLSSLAASLTQGIDSELTADGDAIAFYSTTRPAESAVAEEYMTRADAASTIRTRLSAFLSGLLGDIGEWVVDRDAETGTNDVKHYLIVTATDGHGDRDRAGELERRITQALDAIGAATHLTAESATPHEVVNLAAEYWESGAFPADEVGESAAEAAVPPADINASVGVPGTTPAERALSPTWFAEKSRHVEVGDAVARTFWVANWPEKPPARFLHELYTMPGVDLDIKLYGHPKHRENVRNYLKREGPRIDSEGMNKADSGSMDTALIDDDLNVYVLAYALLQAVDVQPWGLSGYVTVRAPNTEKLRRACERVTKEMKSPPAGMTPKAPFGDQHRTFRSAAPFGADHFAGLGDAPYRATKTHLALGGVFGAALPAAAPTRADPGGVRWGRDVTTGRTIQVDPFQQGGGAHAITVAPTGSGKSFGVKQATQEWWLNGEDRTVIYCDTQGGFEDTVEAFGADHIVIDGQTGINPLDIRPAAAHDVAGTDGEHNQYRLKVAEATEFFGGILRSNGADPAEYTAILKQVIQETYANAGITVDPTTHSRESPEPADLVETLEDMATNTEAYTFTDIDSEKQELESRISNLLVELSGFKSGGEYHHLLSETAEGLSPDIDMAYIDMRQLAGQMGGQSVNLQLAVGQVSQLIKQTEGETIFVIDEAHNLLHSPEMVDWLNKAAREWRRYDAALWFVTQSPQEFVRRAAGSSVGAENKRETIVEQCSTIQLFNCDGVNARTLAEFGLPEVHADVTDNLVLGNSGKGYSECLLSFRDEPGWIRTRVAANPIHRESITFSHREGWSYRDRMRNALGVNVEHEGDVAEWPTTDAVESPWPDATNTPVDLATDGSGETVVGDTQATAETYDRAELAAMPWNGPDGLQALGKSLGVADGAPDRETLTDRILAAQRTEGGQ